MAILRIKSEADYTFKIDRQPGDLLQVVRFTGSEAISEPFQFDLDLASTDGEIDFEKVIGQPGLLTLHGSAGKRHLHGVVNRFDQTGREGKWSFYQARIVPDLWLLSRRATCRIFQNQNIPDILKTVLKEGGVLSDRVRFSLKKGYAPRDYTVQYRESDLAFITRLMEQYGLFYFFEHASDKHVMVISDDPVVHVPIAAPANVIFRLPGTGGVSDQEHLFSFRYHREIRSGMVRLRDFDFIKPRVDLEQQAEAGGDGKLEVYDYPGEYATSEEGADLAKTRLEALRGTEQVGVGQSDCRRFLPGYRFTLAQHDRSGFNREYLLLKVTHTGSQPQLLGAEAAGRGTGETVYQNDFESIPSEIPFRPTRVTPRPMIPGPQTAIVVGPPGEEIYTDEYGRVKVQFHWDRQGKQDEKSSCWVRVAQTTAGAGYGSLFIPRIGHEVIVSFLEGDPDCPLVIGSVYNGDNRPPCDLPAQKVMTSIKSNSSPGGGGSNEIRMDDSKGKEGMNITAQYDCTVNVGNDRNTTVVNNDSLNVSVNRTASVGVNETESVGSNQEVSIGSNQKLSVGSNQEISVGAKQSLSVGADQTVSVGAKRNLTVGGKCTETIGGSHTIINPKMMIASAATYMVTAGAKITKSSPKIDLNAGSAFKAVSGGKVDVKASGKLTQQSGAAMNIKSGAAMKTQSGGAMNLKSGAALKAQASGSVNLKAGGTITQKGSSIKLNSPTKIKGTTLTVS